MLNGVVQSVDDANERSRQTLQPYQSLWLAHWKRTNDDAAGETCSPDASVSEELDCTSRKDGRTRGLEASCRSANGLVKIKNTTFEIGDDFIKAGTSVGNERIVNSVFKNGQDADDVQVLSPESAQNLKAVHSRSGSPSGGCHSVGEDTSNNPPKLMRIYSARKDSLFRSNPLQEKLVVSSSHTFPYKYDVETDKFEKGKSAMSVGSRQTDNSSDKHFRESISCGHSMSIINRDCFMETQKSSEMCSWCGNNDFCGCFRRNTCRFSPTNNDLSSDNGNMSGEHGILPNVGQKELESRSCLYDSEVMECVRDVKASKVTIRNELSGETDTMSMDEFKKKLHSASSNLTASAETLTEVVGHGRLNNKLPDINLNPAAASSPENTCSSSSRGLSLETEKLVEHVKHPRGVDEFPNAGAGNRWVKRLKLSSSSSSYHERRSQVFRGIPTSSHHGEKSLVPGDDKGKALLLSDGWIRRWRQIKSKENSVAEAMVEEKGQFPSINLFSTV